MSNFYDIFTIYDYSYRDINNESMLRVWINQVLCAKKASGGRVSKIRVISSSRGMPIEFKNEITKIYETAGVIFEVNDEPGFPPKEIESNKPKLKMWKLNKYKLYILTHQITPFIFLDLDAFIIAPKEINELLDAADAQPVVAINHQVIPRHTSQFNFKFINAGVLAASKPEFLDCEKIKKTPVKTGCPGQDDQILLWNYFRNIGYDYTNPKLRGAAWNAYGPYKKSLKKRATYELFETGVNISTVTSGLPCKEENNVPVRVLHYWHNLKPWVLKCDIYSLLLEKANKVRDDKIFFQSEPKEEFPSHLSKYTVHTNLQIAHPDDILVNTSVKDGSDSFSIFPISVSYKFSVDLNREQQEILLLQPRIPLLSRKNLIYVEFDENTDKRRRRKGPINRKIIKDNLAKNGFHNKGAKMPYFEFMKLLGDTAFVASPEGNGIDCHRHYETLVMGAIPILEDNALMREKLHGLPIVWTSSGYKDITEKYLKTELETIALNFEKGVYTDRLSSILRITSYTPEQQGILNDRSKHWVGKFIKKA